MASVRLHAHSAVMKKLFQTGKILDLTARERAGKTAAWRKILANYQQHSQWPGEHHRQAGSASSKFKAG
jgi:hypothetical protein